MAIYETYFSLTYPVDYSNLADARDYLDEPMEDYIRNDCGRDRRLEGINPDCILSLRWILEDVDYGYIRLTTTEELYEEQLYGISEWVCGQCSDGLGEGFEQQDWAEPREDYYDEVNDEYYEDECYMCSFDYRTNDYMFERVE